MSEHDQASLEVVAGAEVPVEKKMGTMDGQARREHHLSMALRSE